MGIKNSIDELLEEVGGFLDAGYLRIKLKIEPGWDIEPVRAVRERFGDDVLLQVDANTAYTLADARHLQRLDDFDLLLIEQPLPEEELRGHARLAEMMRTPVCLDESITSAKVTADALAIGACSVVNIKPGTCGRFIWNRVVSTTSARPTELPCGAAECSRPESAGPPTSRLPRSPDLSYQAIHRLPTGTSPKTSPSRSYSTTVT